MADNQMFRRVAANQIVVKEGDASMQSRATPLIPNTLFLNSIPKSGTNLLIQIISGMPGWTHDPRDTFFDPLDYQTSFYRLGRVKDEHFAVGHIYYSPEWLRMLQRLQMKHLLIIRDLRDVLVSLCHFIVEKPEYHQMNALRNYLLTHAPTQEERLLMLIEGIDDGDFHYPNFHDWVSPFYGWLKQPSTYVVRYEDFVRDEASRRKMLAGLVRYLCDGNVDAKMQAVCVRRMEDSIDPRTCGTFRKGAIGDFATHFTPEISKAFATVAGALQQSFGYTL
ncbi:hypothetical protein AAC03nite_37650 [Alicyclobacillus acidoterrestris]|uniref:sulfotransferase domain-containing protein n=1 Tax=Alicyclobacillus suci TaxID=2816080 RepID=UPI00119218F5|nr:sulfotransferase domain-containing protein [Alicyclobacillus suci]GEO27980.1 hypothetical protein AAC03nite_37650 [Alicyclobacillus acidoterrestris]